MYQQKSLDLNINPLVELIAPLFSTAKNAVYKSLDIAYRLIQSAVHHQSIEAMFKLTRYLSADQVLRHAHDVQEGELRSIIMKNTKKLTLPKKVALATDYTEKVYYGDKNHPEVIGSKRGKYVRRYSELSSISPPLFLDAIPVTPFTNVKEELIKQHLDSFSRRFPKTTVSMLCMDKGFYAKKVVQLLAAKKIPFLMPAVKNKAIKKLIAQYEHGLLKNRIRYLFGASDVTLLFLKIEDEVLVSMTNMRITPLRAHLLYSKRWQIETNFREQNKFTFLTRSRDFALRYMAFVLAGLLFNAWQLTRRLVQYALESYVFKQYLLDEILGAWQRNSGTGVVKTSSYFLLA